MYTRISSFITETENLLNGIEQGPINCEIDLSNRCQLNCSYCSDKVIVSGFGNDFSFDLFVRLLPDLKRAGVKTITFTGGGESLMHPNCRMFFNEAKRAGFSIGLITNGLNLEQIKYMIGSFVFIRVSLNDVVIDKQIDILKEIIPLKGNATIGTSYVFSEEVHIENIRYILTGLGIDYEQYKKDHTLKDDKVEITGNGSMVISERHRAKDTKPCRLAGLIAVITATHDVAFCCQSRGRHLLGNLEKDHFPTIWNRRTDTQPDISKCYPCRYLNYLKEYEKIPETDKIFLRHKGFL